MKALSNRIFIISKPIAFWSNLCLALPIEDDRTITIKPIQVIREDKSQEISVFFSAEIDLKYKPKVCKNGIITFPKRERKYLDQALNYYANLVSVSEVCSITISSPTPSYAFIPENQDEKDFLDKTSGLEDQIYACFPFQGGFIEAVGKNQLLDRKEGLAFLAVANSLKDNVARLHEFVRLFERAFAESSSALAISLFKFLSQNSLYDYTEKEIKSWLVDKRHGATHADKRKTFVFSVDLMYDIERMHQAAYDVLFNKAEWNNRGTTRRDLLVLKTVITKGGLTLVRKTEHDVIRMDGDKFTKIDTPGYNFYSNPPHLPENWWFKATSNTIKSQTFGFRVV